MTVTVASHRQSPAVEVPMSPDTELMFSNKVMEGMYPNVEMVIPQTFDCFVNDMDSMDLTTSC